MHIVQYGETLSGIAATYGKTWQELAHDNALINPDLIHVGQSLSFQEVGKWSQQHQIIAL
ncbi:hypothetical protein RyT2_23110 [Pseudolactococcus yaeyamensis]